MCPKISDLYEEIDPTTLDVPSDVAEFDRARTGSSVGARDEDRQHAQEEESKDL